MTRKSKHVARMAAAGAALVAVTVAGVAGRTALRRRSVLARLPALDPTVRA